MCCIFFPAKQAGRYVCWQGARTVHSHIPTPNPVSPPRRPAPRAACVLLPRPLVGRQRATAQGTQGRRSLSLSTLLFRPQGAPREKQPGGEGGIGEDAGDGGAVGGEEGEAEDGADRAPGAAGAGAVHHAHHLRRRQGARPAHHLRRLGPRQGGWAEGLDEQEADEDHDAVDAGEAEAPSHLRPRRATQAVPLHHLVHQSQERAAEAQERSSSSAAATAVEGTA
uniref:Uncharacterized protein n=1 Tax=Oryza punctata TaxID=4537 RepID=A0A0E0LU68_ORYPU